MIRSENITKIAAALVRAQRNIGAAEKGATNPHFKSKFADLGSIMAVCKEPLLAEGVSVIQPIGYDEHGLTLESLLVHESGEFVGTIQRIILAKTNDPQAAGSAITYARRYALQSLLFIPAVDDDAEWARKAMGNAPETPADKPPVKGETPEQAIAAMSKMLEQYDEEIAEATGARKKELQGLRAELLCKIDDLKVTQKPAPIEGNAELVDHDDQIPGLAPAKVEPWQDIVCHVGAEGGKFKGKRLGDIFTGTDAWKRKAMDWFVKEVIAPFEKNGGTKADKTLYDALNRMEAK